MPLRVAVVHEWLDTFAGSEKVLEQILDVLPQADLYSSVDFMSEANRGFLKKRVPVTSFVQDMPFARKYFRKFLPLLALGVENLDLSKYDVVISNSHAVAKGVLTGPKQLHLCYCHSPMRYAWDLQHQYLQEAGLSRGFSGFLAKCLLHYMRLWDLRTVNNVDAFACNSNYIRRRIQKLYRREATVISPPVDVDSFSLCSEKQDFYLTASRLVPYKKVSVVVEAFNKMPSKRLVVIGDGPLFKTVKQSAATNIEMLGYQSFEKLRHYMQRAKAFVFAAEEDFGIVPVEAQACGTPVIAYGHGGATETVIEGKTGVFFPEQTPESIIEAVRRFESSTSILSPPEIRENAERFTEELFQVRFMRFFDEQVDLYQKRIHVSGPS